MFNYVLMAVGFVLVVISFFVSEGVDKRLGAEKESQPQAKDVWTQMDEKNVSERIEAILSEKAEEAVVRTDDQLSQISNEKIMAVSEFSNQLLEKMEQNHSEIIFLYNMLGEKEEEIKKLVRTPVPAAQTPAAPATQTSATPAARTPVASTPKKEKPAASQEKVEKRTNSMEEGRKKQILKLYEEGSSVLEISRELGLGQGEVKLVIDLFQGGK